MATAAHQGGPRGEAGPSARASWLAKIVFAVLLVAWAVRAYGWREPVELRSSVDYAAVVTGGRMIELGTLSDLYAWGDGTFDKVDAPARVEALEAFELAGKPPAFVYPPHVAVLVAPWASLPYKPGLVAWRLCSLVMAFAGAWLWWEAWSPREGDVRTRRHRMFVRGAVLLALMWPLEPLRYALVLGQSTPLMLAMTAGAVWLARNDREVAAGVVLALAASIKLTPAVFGLVFLLDGKFRAATVAAVSGAVLLLVSLVALGWPLHAEWIRALARLSEGTLIAYNNASIDAFVGRFFFQASYAKIWEFMELPPQAAMIGAALKLAVTGALGWVVWQASRRTSDTEAEPAPARTVVVGNLLAAWLLLVPGIAWTHYHIWIVPMVLVAFTSIPKAQRLTLLPALGMTCALVWWPVMPDQVWPPDRLSAVVPGPTYAALLCFATWVVIDLQWGRTGGGRVTDGSGAPPRA